MSRTPLALSQETLTQPPSEVGSSESRGRSGPGSLRGLATLLLLGVLAGESLLLWSHAGHDPSLNYNRDLSLSIDGYWYLAEARAWVLDEPLEVDPHYRSQLLSAVAGVVHWLFGVCAESSRFPNWFAAMLALSVIYFMVRGAYNSNAGIAAACLLAIQPMWLEYARSPILYPLAAVFVCLILYWAVQPGLAKLSVAIALTIGCGFLLKAILWILLPALLLELYGRLAHSGWADSQVWKFRWIGAAALGAGGLLAFGPWAQPDFWRQIQNYLGGDDFALLTQLWNFEVRSNWFSATGLLSIAGLAGAWLLAARGLEYDEEPTQSNGGGRQKAIARVSLFVLMLGLPLFAVADYSPLRYLVIFLPCLVLLALTTVLSLRDRDSRAAYLKSLKNFQSSQTLRTRFTHGVALVGLGVVSLYVILAFGRSFESWGWAERALFSLSLLTVLGALRSADRTLPLLGASLLMATSLPLWRVLEPQPQTLTTAGHELPQLIDSQATLLGPFAHAMTVDNHLEAQQVSSLRFGEGRLRKQLEELGSTHLVTDSGDADFVRSVFARGGVPLELLTTFFIRGELVYLYRFSGVEIARAPFEAGVQARLRGDLPQAVAALKRAVQAAPKSAPGWSQLGIALLASGVPDQAHRALETAIELDPNRLAAHLALAELYYRSGYQPEAIRHLSQALRLDPNHEWASSTLRKIDPSL